MHACMHVCMYVCMYICMYVSMYVWEYEIVISVLSIIWTALSHRAKGSESHSKLPAVMLCTVML